MSKEGSGWVAEIAHLLFAVGALVVFICQACLIYSESATSAPNGWGDFFLLYACVCSLYIPTCITAFPLGVILTVSAWLRGERDWILGLLALLSFLPILAVFEMIRTPSRFPEMLTGSSSVIGVVELAFPAVYFGFALAFSLRRMIAGAKHT